MKHLGLLLWRIREWRYRRPSRAARRFYADQRQERQ